MRKTLILIGLVCITLGMFWPLLGKIPWGRLPGDIVIERGGFRVYLPLGTSLLVSLVLSAIAALFRR